MKVRSKILSYINLTKPEIMLLILVTGATSLVIEGAAISRPLASLMILMGLALTGGSANAFNMYFEREIDAQMARTRKRRPLPLGLIKPGNALGFAIGIGALGIALFGLLFNLISAVLALATIIYYAFFYTLVLKPNTVHNIVIGGAAGAMGPVIAWVAVTGTLNLAPILLFLIIFLWSPPHFFALALCLKRDYEQVKFPMLPIVKGEKATLNQILIYSILIIISSLFLIMVGAGILYLIAAMAFGAILLLKTIRLRANLSNSLARSYFGYSIVYLFGIFIGLIVDEFLKLPIK